MTVQLVVVVPQKEASRFQKFGYAPGRCNAYTVTMHRTYREEFHALLDAHALPPDCVWNIEPQEP